MTLEIIEKANELATKIKKLENDLEWFEYYKSNKLGIKLFSTRKKVPDTGNKWYTYAASYWSNATGIELNNSDIHKLIEIKEAELKELKTELELL